MEGVGVVGWVKDGVRVSVEWHVRVDGRWTVEPVPVGAAPPVNVWVSATRMAPVEYRHQAGECRGECRLPCGHALTYGCDCDTIVAEAADQTGSALDSPCTAVVCVVDTHCRGCARHTGGDVWCVDCASSVPDDQGTETPGHTCGRNGVYYETCAVESCEFEY